MSGIISAIRGGPDSQANIELGIDLARKKRLPLYFLYVVNLDFMIHTESSRIQTISEEMWEMGDFILTEARTQAEAEGVKAEGVVRKGKIGEEILKLCKELEADYVTFGRPRGKGEADFFTHPGLMQLGKRIETETDVEVVYVKEESVDEA